MSVAEMKEKIHQQVDLLDEDRLQVLNNFMEQINEESKIKLAVLTHALQIISERKTVLQKLAQ